MGLSITTGPAAEPINRTSMKLHLRVDHTSDDTLIDTLTQAARSYVETRTRRQIVCATYAYTMDGLPSYIPLPRPPVVAVSSVTYVDTAGDTQTAAATLYDVVTDTLPPYIGLGYGDSWPSTRGHTEDVAITYVAGYAAPFTAVSATDTLTLSDRVPVDGDMVRLQNSGGALPAGLSANTTYYIISSASQTCKLSLTSGGAAVTLTDAGSGTNFIGEVPGPILQAMLLLAGHWYENREAVTVGAMSSTLKVAVDALLAPYCTYQEVE